MEKRKKNKSCKVKKKKKRNIFIKLNFKEVKLRKKGKRL